MKYGLVQVSHLKPPYWLESAISKEFSLSSADPKNSLWINSHEKNTKLLALGSFDTKR